MLYKPMTESLVDRISHSHSLTPSLTHSLPHSLTHSLPHSLTHSLSELIKITHKKSHFDLLSNNFLVLNIVCATSLMQHSFTTHDTEPIPSTFHNYNQFH